MDDLTEMKMVHWWLLGAPRGQGAMLQRMSTLGGGTVRGDRAILGWEVAGHRYRLEVLGINDNHVTVDLDAARREPSWDHLKADFEHIRDAGVIIVRVPAGDSRSQIRGFSKRGQELEKLLLGLGREPAEVPLLFMLDATKDPWLPGFGFREPVEPEHQPEDLIPLFQWPRCAHIVTRFEREGEGIAETLDAAVALWERHHQSRRRTATSATKLAATSSSIDSKTIPPKASR